MTRTMYDSVNVDHLPKNATMVAGYVDGTYRNWEELCQKFPHATKVGIATRVTGSANVLDVEQGDARPDQAPPWCMSERAKGKDPSVYCIYSQWQIVRAEFLRQKVAEPHYWLAKYDNVSKLIPGAVAKQYGGNTAQNWDISIVTDYWPGVDPIPAPVPAPTPIPDIGDTDMSIVFRDPASQNVFVVSGGRKFHIDRPALTQLQAMGATHGEPIISAELTALFPTA